MKTRILMIVLLFSLLATGLAQANGGPARPRQALGSGGTSATTAGVSLRATLGQPLVGSVSGGAVALGQGFWHSTATGYWIYLPLTVKNH